jgi:hypothetical protein
MTTIYWAGGEDCDCYQLGGGAVTTSSFYYRSTYARCALQVTNANDSAWGKLVAVHFLNRLVFRAL